MVILCGMIDRREINASRLSRAVRLRCDAQRKQPMLRDSALQLFKDDTAYIAPQQQLDSFILR